MTDFEINPDLFHEFVTDLAPKLEAATGVGAGSLDQHLARGERTGKHYPQQPYRSSAPGEAPQEQFSDLRRGVYHAPTSDPLVREVGIKDNPQGKLNNLEFGQPDEGGRAPVATVLENEDVQSGMLTAMKGE